MSTSTKPPATTTAGATPIPTAGSTRSSASRMAPPSSTLPTRYRSRSPSSPARCRCGRTSRLISTTHMSSPRRREGCRSSISPSCRDRHRWRPPTRVSRDRTTSTSTSPTRFSTPKARRPSRCGLSVWPIRSSPSYSRTSASSVTTSSLSTTSPMSRRDSAVRWGSTT